MLKLVKPESERQRTENVIEDILRWADDGGQMMDVGLRTAQFYSPAEGIMVDRDDNRLEVAKGFGATQVIHNDLGHAITE